MVFVGSLFTLSVSALASISRGIQFASCKLNSDSQSRRFKGDSPRDSAGIQKTIQQLETECESSKSLNRRILNRDSLRRFTLYFKLAQSSSVLNQLEVQVDNVERK